MSLRPRFSGRPVVSSDGVPRLRYSDPKFTPGDMVDLTLLIGAYGERITTRRLEIVQSRRSPFSGRVEYLLKDDARNRIDYTRWFEEESLNKHDLKAPEARCKRVNARGRPCTATPTFPSGLCIKHKAKLDWDRERQRRKLEAELARRDKIATVTDVKRHDNVTEQVEELGRDPGDICDLVENHSTDTSDQVSMHMWGEVSLFAGPTRQQTNYFQPQPLSQPPTYHTINNANLSIATPALTQHRWRSSQLFRTCLILIYSAGITVCGSLAIALWWSIAHSDPSGGFTMAAYIVAVGGLVLYPVQMQHSKTCRCWSGGSVSSR